MANYLQRVAASGARTTVEAQPPSTGSPVLPPSRAMLADLSPDIHGRPEETPPAIAVVGQESQRVDPIPAPKTEDPALQASPVDSPRETRPAPSVLAAHQ